MVLEIVFSAPEISSTKKFKTTIMDNTERLSTIEIKKMLNIITKDRALILITHDMEMTKDMDRIIKFAQLHPKNLIAKKINSTALVCRGI